MSKPLTAEQFLELIDEFYSHAKENAVSRFDVQWGKWSAKMNREINLRKKNGDPEADKLTHVTIYWVLKSQMLELCCRKPLFYSAFVKRLETEAETVKEMIMSGNVTQVNVDELAALVMGSANIESP